MINTVSVPTIIARRQVGSATHYSVVDQTGHGETVVVLPTGKASCSCPWGTSLQNHTHDCKHIHAVRSQPTAPIPTMKGYTMFLKFPEGETKTVTITSPDPQGERYHWLDGRSVPCSGDACVPCDNGEASKIRYTFAVTCFAKPYQWETNLRIYSQLSEIRDYLAHPDFSGISVTVKRTGTGTNSVYTILPVVPPVAAPVAASAERMPMPVPT